MKSASNLWIFIILTSLLFNCATLKPDLNESLPMQKAYVLLRTEGLEAQINELTSVLNSNFITNKIASDINYYPLGRTWNNSQIFSTAHNNDYDYIILIDQVAKFTIDNMTNVGGKYQIRSYNIKSTNPDWVDLGQKTCNVSVRQSIDKFSQEIISQIVLNYIPSQLSYNEDKMYAEKKQTQISEIDYNQLKSSEEIDIELAELRKQLIIEKERTNKAIAEKERLEKEYEQALNSQKKKNQTVLEGLESFKKEQELAEVNQLEEIRKEEEKQKKELALAEAKNIEEKRLAQAKEKKAIRLKELETKAEEKRLAEVKVLEEKRLDEESLTKAQLLEEKRIEEERIAEDKRLEEIRLKELETKAEEKRLAEVKVLEEKQLEEERLAEARRIEDIRLKELEKKAEEERLAEEKFLEEKRLEEERLAEAERLEEIRIKELEKKAEELLVEAKSAENKPKTSLKKKPKKSSNKTKESSMSLNKPIDKSNALLIIRGKEEDFNSFNKLKDNLEFELLFANIKASTQIINLKDVVNKEDLLNFNQPNYQYLIFIEQFDTLEDGYSKFGISVYPSNSNSTWKDLEQRPFNLNDRTSLKEFSKTVLKSL